MQDFEEIFDGLIRRLLDVGEIDREDPTNPINPKPFADQEIQSIEASFGVTFPEAYRTFLRRMGGGAGFLKGEYLYASIDLLPGLNDAEAWQEIGVEIQGRLFCFGTLMGDCYYFFRTTEDEPDPQVLFVNEFLVGVPTAIPQTLKEMDVTFLGWLDTVVKQFER